MGARDRAGEVVRCPYGAAETAPVDDRDVAAVAARTLYQDGYMTPDEFRRLSEGTPSSVVDMLLTAWSVAVGQPAYVTTAVADILRTAPRTLHQWAANHASAFAKDS
ncbi:hypothetical protein [Streptomyces incarnatus]|uniref:hypothetical protein n=1 Tax=Streptomyces incarnatus TaxID=665007 RepID=UPI001FC950BE|nr:hypothetical protein [Streptomyces incarnatus]